MRAKKQRGFTLVELMVSLILGSMVSASAITVYLLSQKNQALQEGLKSNQSAVGAGLEYLVESIERAGEVEFIAERTNLTPDANIITRATNYGYGFSVSSNYLSMDQVGASYTDKRSDQLVLKYTPKETGGYDCEGNAISSTSIQVVERFFVRVSDDGTDLVLACDAGRFNGTTLSGMGGNGAGLIPQVDHFHVMLTTANMNRASTQNFRNYTLAQYRNLTTGRRIAGVNIGLITHSAQPIGYAGMPRMNNTIRLFSRDVELNNSVQSATNQYLYSVNMRSVSIASNFVD